MTRCTKNANYTKNVNVNAQGNIFITRSLFSSLGNIRDGKKVLNSKKKKRPTKIGVSSEKKKNFFVIVKNRKIDFTSRKKHSTSVNNNLAAVQGAFQHPVVLGRVLEKRTVLVK